MKNNQNTARQIWREFLRNESAELAKVAKAVSKQMHGQNAATLQELYEIYKSPCGVAGGFTGFIYYTETVEFWRKNRAAVLALMNYDADSLGENDLCMCSTFGGLKDYTADEIGRALYGRHDAELTQIYNIFAWYAAEAVAYRFGEYVYENDIDPYNIA